MSLKIIVASPSSTVRNMVGISLANLPCEFVMVNSGAKFIQQTANTRFDLAIIGENLAGTETKPLIEQTIDNSASKGTPTVVLRNRKSSFAVEFFGPTASLSYVNMPVLSQSLVQTVCPLVGIDVPDERLYAPYLVSIPLASTGIGTGTAQLQNTEAEGSRNAELANAGLATKQSANEAPKPSQDESKVQVPITEQHDSPDLDHMTTQADFQSIRRTSPDEDSNDSLASIGSDGTKDSHIENAVVIETSSFGVVESAGQDTASVDNVIQTVTDTVSDRLMGPKDVVTSELTSVTRELIEQVVWEIVPELAEALLKEEIARLLSQPQTTASPA